MSKTTSHPLLSFAASSPSAVELTDEMLVERYRAERRADLFERIVRRYERELYAFLRRFLGDDQLADDAFQGTFIAVHQRLDQFEAGRRFRPWLYAVATNKAIDLKRQAKRRTMVSLDATHTEDDATNSIALSSTVESREPSPLEAAMDQETRLRVRKLLEQMNESTQLLLQMVFYQGMKYSDISESLGIPVGTVKSRVFNAMRKLNELWHRNYSRETDSRR